MTAYLTVASLHVSCLSVMGKKNRPQRKGEQGGLAAHRALVEIPSETGDCKFARALGSNDYVTREKGVQALTRWLACRDGVDELDMLKIWKGLFYSFWHSDLSKVQVNLILSSKEPTACSPQSWRRRWRKLCGTPDDGDRSSP